ncbi:uncharacterized protein V1513DRAFT_431098 [Lipomyces chichibuensis]|uniref:uncharacterized protein n=1 Tax=Lipomyces chichibuensis TaxID=1546026 RepID=UPI003344193B
MNEKHGLPGDDLSLKLPNYTARAPEQSASATPFRTKFASLSMHMTDRIRLLRFPDRDVTQILNIIRLSWPRGIQDTRDYDAAKEVKLYGRPWSLSSWGAERTEARRLICQILHGLFDMGWILQASVDISKKEYDKDTLLFRYQQPPPPSCIWMSISFNRSDRLQLIDVPQELGPLLVQAYGEKVQDYQFKGSVFEIKFRGYPWQADGTETVQTRLMLLTLLECLEQQGFSLYASIDQDSGSESSNSSEADTLFCNRQADWTPGAPIYHG